jgi:hypothetical protein
LAKLAAKRTEDRRRKLDEEMLATLTGEALEVYTKDSATIAWLDAGTPAPADRSQRKAKLIACGGGGSVDGGGGIGVSVVVDSAQAADNGLLGKHAPGGSWTPGFSPAASAFSSKSSAPPPSPIAQSAKGAGAAGGSNAVFSAWRLFSYRRAAKRNYARHHRQQHMQQQHMQQQQLWLRQQQQQQQQAKLQLQLHLALRLRGGMEPSLALLGAGAGVSPCCALGASPPHDDARSGRPGCTGCAAAAAPEPPGGPPEPAGTSPPIYFPCGRPCPLLALTGVLAAAAAGDPASRALLAAAAAPTNEGCLTSAAGGGDPLMATALRVLAGQLAGAAGAGAAAIVDATALLEGRPVGMGGASVLAALTGAPVVVLVRAALLFPSPGGARGGARGGGAVVALRAHDDGRVEPLLPGAAAALLAAQHRRVLVSILAPLKPGRRPLLARAPLSVDRLSTF